MFLNQERRGHELGGPVTRVNVGALADDVKQVCISVFLTGVDVCQTSVCCQSSKAAQQLIQLSQWSRDECQECT